MMFTRVFRKRIILTIIISVSVQVFLYTMILAYWNPEILQPTTAIEAATTEQEG
jgi:hypothetical protein